MTEIKLSKLIEDNPTLKVISGQEYVADKVISVSDISRPGLELTGYFDFYPKERVQLFGKTEISYADRLDSDMRSRYFGKMAQPETPCFLVARDLPLPNELVEAAEKAHVPVLKSSMATTRLSALLAQYLYERLAPRKSMHGVLMQIYGIGVMIVGSSGIGKSETALSLIKRGHRLISDDRVDVFQKDERTLMGEAPKILRHLIEIRGIGIINIMDLFGVGAVKDRVEIRLVIRLVDWNPDTNYERLGLDENKVNIFNVEVPQITVPVKVGRNMAIIIEAAAMNFRAEHMGYNAIEEFQNNLTKLIEKNSQRKDEH